MTVTGAVVHHNDLPLEVSAGKETHENTGDMAPRGGEVTIQSKTGLESVWWFTTKIPLRTQALISQTLVS